MRTTLQWFQEGGPFIVPLVITGVVGLLTLIVSLESIFLSIFVLVSQNRQSERDRIRTDLDYQVNVKAHVEIMGIARRLDRIEQRLPPWHPVDGMPVSAAPEG